MNTFVRSMGVIVLSLCVMCTCLCAQEGTVRIGVLANKGGEQCISQWGETAKYLTSAIPGKTFEIVPLPFEEVFPAIEGNKVDFFLVNSSMYVTAEKKFNTTPIATMKTVQQGQILSSFGGVIFTSAEHADINSLADLKGKAFMAVDQTSFGGWQMGYKELLDAGVTPADFSELQYGKSHDAVVQAVLAGKVAAGTVRTDTIEKMIDGGFVDMEEIKILNEKKHEGFPFVCSTALYPEWPFAKTQATSAELAAQVSDALKKLTQDDEASKKASIAGWGDPLSYQVVDDLQKTLKIGAYEVK